ncbi:MAG: diacylglycerol kinase catalytic region [Frankiales bacterium]|nr:diacylglycerol kinase catalytic region [Frankiales bacterium]
MTSTDRVAVVLNPTSLDDPAPLRAAIEQRMRDRRLGEPLWLETTADDAGAGMADEAMRAGVDLLLVCGGDGTVAAVAGALAEQAGVDGPLDDRSSGDGKPAGEMRGTPPALGVLAIGTGNLLARNLGLPLPKPAQAGGFDAALDVAFGAGRRRLDVLDSGSRRFLVMAGIGFDAAMIRHTDDRMKAKVGWLAYLGGLTRALHRSPQARFEVRVDDGPPLVHRGVGVLVGNVGKLQGGVEVLPEASPDDGRLAVLVLSPKHPADWLILLGRVLRRRPDGGRQAELLRGRQVRIRADRPLPIEYDGDFDGLTTNLCVTVLPGAVQLCTELEPSAGEASGPVGGA